MSIAIIGMACRFPDAASPEQLWETVLARRRAFRAIPAERLRLADYVSRGPDDADSIYAIEAAVLEDYSFDRARFRVPAPAMAATDLTHWLALEVAADALADAGLAVDALDRARTGVVVGNTLTGEFSRAGLVRLRWPYVRRQLDAALAEEGFDAVRRTDFLERFELAYKEPFPPPDEESLAGGLSNTIAGRICNHYDLHGGGFTVDGACASSLLAVAVACDRLASGAADVMLVGGVDLSLDPFELVGFARNGALSKTLMRVFDAHSDGFWPGEGCGFVVLARAEDTPHADRHHALLRGWGMSTDGAGGLTRPTVPGQLAALQQAYARAGFGAGSVPLFEAHGTGTPIGDPTEVAAIAAARRASGISVPAAIGSIKANIGHAKAAAGIAGLIKTVMALQRQVLPAATGCEQVHPAILEHGKAVTVAAETRLWPPDWPLRAGVSAMGFGGINLHIVLENDAPRRRDPLDAHERSLIAADQDAELFLLAATDSNRLRRQVAALAELAPRLSRAELADAAAALAARLDGGGARAMVVAASPAELTARLGRLLDRIDGAPGSAIDVAGGIALSTGADRPRIGFLFPGQAARVRVDGGAWGRRFPEAAAVWSAAALPVSGDSTRTEIAQPAIVAASLAGLAVLQRLGIDAAVAIGHSLGELTALHWAGAYDAAALLRLAAARGGAMAELALPGGTMALLGTSAEQAGTLLAGTEAVIACRNGPRECVVAGGVDEIAAIRARAEAGGIPVQPLAVSHAFHSRFVAPAAAEIARLVAAERPAPLLRGVISTVTGKPLASDTDLAALLRRQVTAPVRFAEALAQSHADLLIEVGPGHGLSRIVTAQSGAPAIGIDAGGTAFAGLLRAAGAAFVLGAPVRADRLFEERFVRPFDLDRPRRFLANPCETAPLDTAARRRREPAAATPIAPAAPSMAGSSPLEALRAVLARRLQMDAATIEPRQRLLGDLHLNSIAVGQIVGETARVLGLAPPAAPTDFALASVGEVAEALSASAALPAVPEEAFPAGVASWVRGFVPDLVPRALDGPVRAMPPAWRIHAPDGHKLAGRLAALAAPSGREPGGAMICLGDNPGLADLGLLLDGAQTALSGDGDAPVLVLQQDGGGAAFARCLSLEHPRLRVCVIDLPFAHGDAVAWVAAEAARASPGYREVHYDTDGKRRVPVLRLLDAPPSPVCELGPDDVVLVSGGAKGISAECALALARQTGARLGLLGRSPAAAPEVAATMQRLHAAGIAAAYAEADVTDRQAVAGAVAQLVQDLGPITAVLHGAGVNRPTPLASLTPEVLDATVAVKVDGLRHILAALEPDRLRLLIGFSSIIARAGLPGEAHYAVANEWLGRLIATYCARHPTCRPLVLEWSVWSGVGMGETLGAVAALSRQGVAPLPIEAARSVFASLVAAPPAAQPVVVAGRFGAPPTIEPAGPPVPPSRFLERLAVHYPGVELVAEAHLRSATDPYLAEHAVAGTELFPAVLGLEAMAQAASALANEPPRQFEQVLFHRPIALQADGGTVRVAALRHPDHRIETVIRDGAVQFQADSMSATAWMTAGNAPAAREHGEMAGPLSLRPADVYGRLLFHQGRFRRITAYHHLSATSCIARIGPAGDGRWFPARDADDLVLGDPGARDAALHALQACIPHRRVLPVAARRIRLGCLRPDRDYLVQGRETARDGDRFRFDLEICEVGGPVVEWWEGLELKAVEPLEAPSDWPLPLLGPLLERRLHELMPGRDIRVAVAGAAEGAPPDSAALLATLLPAGDRVSRRPDGRPEADAAVSASHAGPLTLAATAAAAVGCDIEAIVQRPEPAWRDLLGAERFALAQLIVETAGEPLDCSATRVWSAIEALKKAGASVSQAPLTLIRREADWIVLAAGSFGVVSWHAAIGPARCAIAIACQAMGSVEPRETRQPVYSYRHVVGFQDTNLVGNVYFVNHLEWQGRCREMFLRDKAPSVMEELGRGLSLATTHASCDYLEELRAFDEVEIDMRLVALNESRMTLGFEYWRCPRDGRPVAVGQQELVWLREVGGRKVPASVPAEFLQALKPYASGQS